MRKLAKKRMLSYLHPTGMVVRGYSMEGPDGLPEPPSPPAPAQADSTATKTNQAHISAGAQIAVDALKGAIYGAASGAAAGPSGMIRGAGIGAVTKGAESFVNNCTSCHKKN